jgi:hypothetical protein
LILDADLLVDRLNAFDDLALVLDDRDLERFGRLLGQRRLQGTNGQANQHKNAAC